MEQEKRNRSDSTTRDNLIVIPDNQTYDLDMFLLPDHYKPYLSNVLIPHGFVLSRAEKMANDIRQAYGNETVHLLCVLKGGQQFFCDLMTYLKRCDFSHSDGNMVPFTFDFVRVKSYDGTKSTGKVTITGVKTDELKGKHVLLVEDIVDTGLTMSKLVPELIATAEPKSCKVATLLEKRNENAVGFKADFVGFSVPNAFVVGYCLDYNEVYRELDHICIINQSGIERFADV